jgi:hypothetical protein
MDVDEHGGGEWRSGCGEEEEGKEPRMDTNAHEERTERVLGVRWAAKRRRKRTKVDLAAEI